jgi:hypothetical protein
VAMNRVFLIFVFRPEMRLSEKQAHSLPASSTLFKKSHAFCAWW